MSSIKIDIGKTGNAIEKWRGNNSDFHFASFYFSLNESIITIGNTCCENYPANFALFGGFAPTVTVTIFDESSFTLSATNSNIITYTSNFAFGNSQNDTTFCQNTSATFPNAEAKIGFASAKVSFAAAKTDYASAKIGFASARIGFASAKIIYASAKTGNASAKTKVASAKIDLASAFPYFAEAFSGFTTGQLQHALYTAGFPKTLSQEYSTITKINYKQLNF